MNELDEYRQLGLDFFQLQEVKTGFEHGLTIDQVNFYAKPEYDNLQMQELRLGLEHGLTADQMKVFARPEIDADAMNHSRIQIENGNVIEETAKADLHKKRLNNGLIAVIGVVGILLAVLVGSIATGDLKAWFEPLDLELVSNKVELEYGTVFNPADYIKDYTKGTNTELILPDPIDTTSLGEYKVLFQLKNSKRTIDKTMTVVVVDRIPPTIVLNTYDITLIKGEDELTVGSYLVSADDELDGNLFDAIETKVNDVNDSYSEVIYSVKDSSNNVGTATLNVHWKEPEPEPVVQPAPMDYATSQQQIQEQQQASGSSTPSYSAPQSTNHGTINYMFADGYDIDSAYNQCVLDGQTLGNGNYTCTPIMSEGLYVGYTLSY